MDFTSRMLRLLEAVRRERNGEVAASMCYYGTRYGLNYGVSLPTVRTLARAEGTDDAFAAYLYQQQVRELQLAALWIADPGALTAGKAGCWGNGIINSEVAEEAALALLGRAARIGEVFAAWTAEGVPVLWQYAALLGAARNPLQTTDWLPAAAEVVCRNPDDRLTAGAMVALLAALAQKEENRRAVLRTIGSLGASPSADRIHEEIAWRLEA